MKDSYEPIRRVLREMGELAEQASLTGSLRSGSPRLAEHYNAIVDELTSQEAIPAGLFKHLDPQTVEYGEIGVDARMLMAYLPGDKDKRKGRRFDFENDSESNGNAFSNIIALAPFLQSQDLAVLVQEKLAEGNSIAEGLLPALAPFLDSRTLSEIIRNRPKPTPPQPPQSTPEPPKPPEPKAEAPHETALATTTPSRETLQHLATQLSDPNLTEAERANIGLELAKIAHEIASVNHFGE